MLNFTGKIISHLSKHPSIRSLVRFQALSCINISKPLVVSSKFCLCRQFSSDINKKVLMSPILKKRPVKKKRLTEADTDSGLKYVVAFSTAEEYDLEGLMKGLKDQKLYQPTHFIKETCYDLDVVYATANYQVNSEKREIFFFREGSIVMWNLPELEVENLLTYIKKFESNDYPENIVHDESEIMQYSYLDDSKSALNSGNIKISIQKEEKLEKYTFSNALALSVKLGIWEASLDKYIDSMELVTEDLKKGFTIKMSQEEVLRKTGELFALRHLINLSSDLLDTPDFYWDREDLENLYQQMCGHMSISRRTRVMNEKLNHCVELVQLLSSHLSDRHHVRLEWMIIILIMVEVGFEILHYIDRYYQHENQDSFTHHLSV